MSESTEVRNLQGDMLHMFASVWVKVEVNGESEGIMYQDPIIRTEMSSYSKKSKKSTCSNPKTLKCDNCDYTTIYKNCLKIHVQGHTDAKPLACEVCGYTTRYPTSLKRHILIQHNFKEEESTSNTLKCDQCEYSTHFKWNLSAHKRKHKLDKQFKCTICGYETAYRHNFIKHGKVHKKQEVLYKCDKCPFVTKFEGHISRHLAKIHNEISDKANKCDLCDFSTKTRWRLNIHKQRSKQSDVLKCSFCEFQTIFMCESKKHKVTHYNEVHQKGSTEQAEDVNITLRQLSTARNHNQPVKEILLTAQEKANHYVLDPNCEQEWNSIKVNEVTNTDRPFQCIKCKYAAKFKASVQRHYQRHHTGNQKRPFKCTNCGFTTKTKDQIALHIKRSKSDMLLHCNACEYTTDFKCQYVSHQKCHYPHKCTVCNYTCKQKYEILKHFSVTHMGRGLKCRFCDYKAPRKESLICHETIHTGNKPFKCCLCEYRSLRKSLLDKHMKRFHGQVKYDTVVVSDSKIQSLKISPENNFEDHILSEIYLQKYNEDDNLQDEILNKMNLH